MAIAVRGLRVKPLYGQLINVAVSDGLEQIKFLNRDAAFLRDGFVLSQLDGDGMRIMENNKKWHLNKHFKKLIKRYCYKHRC